MSNDSKTQAIQDLRVPRKTDPKHFRLRRCSISFYTFYSRNHSPVSICAWHYLLEIELLNEPRRDVAESHPHVCEQEENDFIRKVFSKEEKEFFLSALFKNS